MCTVSMIMDHYGDKWKGLKPIDTTTSPFVVTYPEPAITDEEIREFRDLLERARKYDEEHGEPDCELREKKQKILDLAEEYGIEIDFL